jgi:RNA polymerase sigma factor (sigma-70 family)
MEYVPLDFPTHLAAGATPLRDIFCEHSKGRCAADHRAPPYPLRGALGEAMAQEDESPQKSNVAASAAYPAEISRGGIDEAELARRISRGDAEAERLLVRRFMRPITVVLKRHTTDPDLVQDLVQDTFISVLLSLRNGQLRMPEMLASFLLQTARNIAANARRKQVRHGPDADTERLAQLVDINRSPIDLVSDADLGVRVQAAIAGLGVRRDRELLRRHYLEDADRSALQSDFGLTAAQFDRVLCRARTRLREILGALIGDRT